MGGFGFYKCGPGVYKIVINMHARWVVVVYGTGFPCRVIERKSLEQINARSSSRGGSVINGRKKRALSITKPLLPSK